MEIVLITGNPGKKKEISKWLSPIGIEVKTEPGPFIEVQTDTLEEVITYGMKVIQDERGDPRWFMKDDSGLFIDSLTGFPGVYSSYIQRTIGNKGILQLMEGNEQRGASFVTVIGLNVPGKGISLFKGECRGNISLDQRGREGFGFDPIFRPEGKDRTFAEMDIEEKNSISHRIKAARKMVEFLKTLDL